MAWYNLGAHNTQKTGTKAAELARPSPAEQALDAVVAPIMTLDAEFHVIFANAAAQAFVREARDAFRDLWPAFPIDRMEGAKLDFLSVSSDLQVRHLSDLARQPKRTELRAAERVLGLTISALPEGAGFTLEWQDLTRERLIEATRAGQLDAIRKSLAVAEYMLDGRLSDANPRYCEIMGYQLDEIRGQHHSSFVDPAHRVSRDYLQLWHRLGNGEAESGQFRRAAKGGREIWIQAAYHPITDATGKPFKVIEYATDITADRIKAGVYEAKLAAIGKVQAIAEFSPDGKLIDANAAFCDALGYTLDEIKDRHHSHFVDQAVSGSQEYRNFWDRLSRRESDCGQCRMIGKGGKQVVFQAIHSPLSDETGKVIAIIMAASDITEFAQKAADDALELQIRTDIMNTTSIVSYADLKGDILTINDKFIEISKYSREELIGKPHNTTRHPDMPKEVFKDMWSTIGRGKMFRGVIKNRAKDGTPYYVDAVVAPFLGENGKPKKYLGVRYDITAAEIERHNMRGIFEAINGSYAYIEFDTGGHVTSANDLFLQVMGYQLAEITGKHHRQFVETSFSASPAYSQFWADLNAGKAQSGLFKRVNRQGHEVWIQAVYAPVKDEVGRVAKVIKIATDVTAERLRSADFEGQLKAISKAQAVIEFSLDGKILTANENFCQALGYSLEEIRGQHHSMFADPAYRASPEYRMFWEKLGRGEYDAGQYKRIAKGGREIWIQASYNPILDLNGKPFKVVKYASDITEQVRAQQMMKLAVEQVQSVVVATKDNDLSKRIPLEGKSGELETLCSGVNGLIDTMSEVVANITENAATITTAVSEITSGTDDLSRRTEKQASSLQETSASMEEMASTIRQNAENAQQANQLAIGARGLASDGGEIVHKAVQAMSRIEESSGKMSDIIGVIDEIAFQTNLLALNAAVEAARAGDAGRGFAVVASEVRSLAQRSSEAAKDIKTLIVQSSGQVKDGVKLVNDAGGALNEIVGSVKQVTDIVSEIAAASQEQSVGVQEINKAVSQMDEMTQQNSALVEENAAACRLLQDQAEDMSNRMAAFRLDESAAAKIVSRASPPTRRPEIKSPVKQVVRTPVRKVAGGGRNGAVALQQELHANFQEDGDWKEF